MPKTKMPVPILLALTLGPALMIGSTLWVVNDLVPACTITEAQRLTAPDDQFDLVTFSRSSIGITLPPDAEILRQDPSVAGIAISYR